LINKKIIKMVQEASYRCLDCGDILDYEYHCIIHAMDWKHKNFEMLGTDIKMVIKAG
jgi:hypothetical protein